MTNDRRKDETEGPTGKPDKEDLAGRLRSELFSDAGSVGMDAEYKIGYRKPPLETRFNKGVSGNPAGRPRRKRQPDAPHNRSAARGSSMRAFSKELSREVVVQEAGEPKKMPLLQAALRQLEQLAFKGSVNASKELVRLTMEEARRKDAEIAEDHEFWIWYCERFEVLAQRGGERGAGWPEWMPWPEDISLPQGQKAVIKGPRSPEELEIFQRLVKLRDACIAKTRYDAVVFPPTHREDSDPQDIPVNGLLPYLIDLMMPKRMELSADGICERMMDAISSSRERLAAELVRALAELGYEASLNEPDMPVGHSIYRLGLDPARLREATARSRQRYRATGMPEV